MRWLIYIIVACSAFSLQAQDSIQQERKWLVGGNGKIYIERFGGQTGRLILELDPQAGYFVTQQWALGLRLPLEFLSNEFSIGLRPWVRYYIPVKGNVLPFVEANGGRRFRYTFDVNSGDVTTTTKSWTIGAQGGAAFLITNQISIDLFLYYDGRNERITYQNGEESDPQTKQFFGLGAGFVVYLK